MLIKKVRWNDIRKTIDYFCHFAKTPIDFDNIKNNDSAVSTKDIFNKILIGDDKDFSSNTKIHFTEPNNERKMSVYLTDDTEDWFTRIHVQIKG